VLVTDPMFQESDQPSVVDRVEETPDVGVQDEVHFTSGDLHHQRIQRVVLATPWPKTAAEPEKTFLMNTLQHRQCRLLDDLILPCDGRQRALFTVALGYHDPPGRLRPVRTCYLQ
jgi:hypothetical protein